MSDCGHILGEGSTLVVAADGCSLECTVCHEIVLAVELLQVLFVVGDQVVEEWVEGGTRLTTISPDGSRRTEFIPDES